MELIGNRPDYTGHFGDKRLAKRAEKLAQSLLSGRTSSIHGTTQSEAEQRGLHRFICNENVTEASLIEELTHRCGKHVEGRHLLVMQDSSSVGLSQQANHIKPGSGVGLIGNKIGLGFMTHISLVVDVDSEAM